MSVFGDAGLQTNMMQKKGDNIMKRFMAFMMIIIMAAGMCLNTQAAVTPVISEKKRIPRTVIIIMMDRYGYTALPVINQR